MPKLRRFPANFDCLFFAEGMDFSGIASSQRAKRIGHFPECAKAMQIAISRTLLFMAQAVLDAEKAVPFLCKDCRCQMPYGMKAKTLHTSSLAKPFHDMRGCPVGLPHKWRYRTGKDIIACPLPVFPKPAHCFPHFWIHRHFILFYCSGTGFLVVRTTVLRAKSTSSQVSRSSSLFLAARLR